MTNNLNDNVNKCNYDTDLSVVKMFEKIEFPLSSTANDTNMPFRSTIRRRNKVNSFCAQDKYSVNSLPHALNVSFEKKCKKISLFMRSKKTSNDLRVNLSHLYGFARSADGLILDKYRERVWPILAECIPRAPKILRPNCLSRSSKHLGHQKPSCCSVEFVPDNISDTNDNSDSDFESALSTFSVVSNDYNVLADNDVDIEKLEPSLELLRTHKEWNQVELDVNRTLARFPPNFSDNERNALQQDLTPLIVRVLFENANYNYYQGFHDVCLTLLLAMNVLQALKVARLLCQRASFYNYLTSTLEESAMSELDNLYVLLYMHDGEVEKYLRDAELGTLFALSWPITWFSHDLPHYSQIVVFFDFFLSSHPLMPIYVSVALIAERRNEILRCEQEMPYLHNLLKKIPENINVNRILDTARSLFARYPPILVQGEFRREYDKICARHRRKKATIAHLQQRSDTIAAAALSRRSMARISRYNMLVSPWLMFGTAGAAAFCLWISKNYLGDGVLF